MIREETVIHTRGVQHETNGIAEVNGRKNIGRNNIAWQKIGGEILTGRDAAR